MTATRGVKRHEKFAPSVARLVKTHCQAGYLQLELNAQPPSPVPAQTTSNHDTTRAPGVWPARPGIYDSPLARYHQADDRTYSCDPWLRRFSYLHGPETSFGRRPPYASRTNTSTVSPAANVWSPAGKCTSALAADSPRRSAEPRQATGSAVAPAADSRRTAG